MTLFVEVHSVDRARLYELRRIQKVTPPFIRNFSEKPGEFTRFFQRAPKQGARC